MLDMIEPFLLGILVALPIPLFMLRKLRNKAYLFDVIGKVELTQAFAFQCLRCGTYGFANSVEFELIPGEMDHKLREMFGLDQWQEIPENLQGHIVSAPRRVVCSRCGGIMDVEHREQEED